MKFHYDPETDSLYIELLPQPGADAAEIAPDIVADFNADGQIVGLDVQHASRRVDLSRLEFDGLLVPQGAER